jgi:2-dehydro-3-deoxyphosphogluconate aldolase/(4S)-4-hydroxy-2-oxoglutarate aldolase
MIIDKESTLRRVREVGVLAVSRGPSPELTVQMVDALVAGGVFGIEITYSTPNAAEVVKNLDEKYGEKILLGMGTLTEPRQVAEAKAAGARFLVSPHLDETLAQAMISTGLLVMIGALTPTEVVRAHQLGSDVVKLFPGSLGGPAYLKALRGPFPHIPMMPTGGVSQDNIAEWLAAGAVAVGAGSNLCPPALAKEGRFEEITAIAQTFVAALNQARRSK